MRELMEVLEDGFKKHEDLVDDEEHAVRRNVAKNLNCPAELLAMLANLGSFRSLTV